MNAFDLVMDEEISEMNLNEGKHLVNKRAREKWQNRWNSSLNCSVLYE